MGRSKLCWSVLVAFAMMLPWLNPLAPGPSPSVIPWLIALVAAASLMLLEPLRAPVGSAMGDSSFADRWAQPIAWAWLLAGLSSSAIGLLQYFGTAAVLDPWVNQTVPGEAFANLRQRNQFASLTNMALAALVWAAAGIKADGRLGGRDYLVLLAACLLAVGNAASSSRTGLAQLVLVAGLAWVWGAWRQPEVRRVVLTAMLAYVMATLALPGLAGFDLSTHGMFARLSAGDGVCAGRLTLWSNVLHLIAQKPWLGWGWGELDYAHYITLYDGPRFCEILDNAHNLPLQLAVELGVPAAVVVCGGFGGWALRQRPWRETDPGRQLAWMVLAVILLHSMLEYPLWYGPFQMAFVLCVGVLVASRQRQNGSPKAVNTDKYLPKGPLAQSIRLFIAIISIAFAFYAAWDYHRVSQIYLTPTLRSAAYKEDTLEKVKGSWLFDNQVRFADLMLTSLTPATADRAYQEATALLHYSPEPRVIEKVIESAALSGRDGDALLHLVRYRAAFPEDHSRWAKANASLPANATAR